MKLCKRDQRSAEYLRFYESNFRYLLDMAVFFYLQGKLEHPTLNKFLPYCQQHFKVCQATGRGRGGGAILPCNPENK